MAFTGDILLDHLYWHVRDQLDRLNVYHHFDVSNLNPNINDDNECIENTDLETFFSIAANEIVDQILVFMFVRASEVIIDMLSVFLILKLGFALLRRIPEKALDLVLTGALSNCDAELVNS